LLLIRTDEVAEQFLRLEKYVNINFMGFHKILKKHDKYVMNHPCREFYVSRLHAQAWVRGDYSDVVIRLSAIYSTLRKDVVDSTTPVMNPQNPPDAANNPILKTNASFYQQQPQQPHENAIRSTTKYWVKTEDVSRVKYAILRHLPVYLQKTSTGESDSQLTNSVYLDNDQLELYHGRLDEKASPGSIALRLRWYGATDPDDVYMERLTHREKWTGETSVRERILIKEKEVQHFMNDTYPIDQMKTDMVEEKGMAPAEVEEWEYLTREITQVIASKQLVPTMRTQYMRTAFQIPFDSTVRVNLDTNLCMISERGYDLKNKTVWHRDNSAELSNTEITRFPHAVLEIKLDLNGDGTTRTNKPPKWVSDLQNSGLLYEVHKFSKFLHGCAALLPEDVRSVPYWIDDISVRDSLLQCGAERILVPINGDEASIASPSKAAAAAAAAVAGTSSSPEKAASTNTRTTKNQKNNNSNKLVPVSNYGANFYGDADLDEEEEAAAAAFLQDDDGCFGEDSIGGWLFPFCSPHNAFYETMVIPTTPGSAGGPGKIEPKVFFANERTYLHWLHAGVTLYTIATGILAFSAEESASWAHWYAMLLLPISLGFCLYALYVFLWRADRIKSNSPGLWDDPRGPILLGSVVCVVLLVNFFSKVYQIAVYEPEL